MLIHAHTCMRHARMHARTQTHTLFHSFLGFIWYYPDEPATEETFTHLPILIISHPLSGSSIYYNPWHPPCSIYMPDSPFAQPLSNSSLVYLLVWPPPLHTPYVVAIRPIGSVIACDQFCQILPALSSGLYLELESLGVSTSGLSMRMCTGMWLPRCICR